MVGVKRILCLANSRTLAGRCVAGRVWGADGEPGDWVRPVSERQGGDVSEYERQYEDGSDPGVLDVVDVPVLKAQPAEWQTENWLLDPRRYWRKAGVGSWFDLARFADGEDERRTGEALWQNGFHTYNGRNDKIPLEAMPRCRDSLRFIHVRQLRLEVFRPGEAFGNSKRRVQGRFRHAGSEYRLWVTDPNYERRYLARLNGHYAVDDCFLTIRLGEPYQDACHKLIAAVIESE